jgi:hypothetical protein
MSTHIKSVKRSLVSLRLPIPVPELLATAKAVVSAMTDNAAFATPDPALATLTAAIADLEAAETAVKLHRHGAVPDRNEKRKALATLLEHLKAYIQKVADTDSDTAETVIRSAAVGVRQPVLRQKQTFTVKEGPVSGSVKLTAAAAGPRSSYEWQYSVDGAKTWQTMPPTIQAKTSIQGLPVSSTVLFRCRAVTPTGEQDWTQPLAIVVK